MNNRFIFFLFNILFISLTQSLLLFLISTPAYEFLLLAQVPDAEPFGLPDLVFSRVAFFFIIIEYFADHQQWNFHRAKRDYQDNARIAGEFKEQFSEEDLERGFVVSGLWSWCRHPNFTAEQAVWLALHLWSCYRTNSYFQWTSFGVLGYLAIFQGSTRLTEDISAGKYPEYRDYQARVGRFIPRFSVEPKGKRTVKEKRADSEDDGEASGQKTTKEGKKSK